MSLNHFYLSIGTTKQAFHSKLNKELEKNQYLGQVELIVRQARVNHPGMCLRDLYRLIAPECMGRDAFEIYFSNMGYGVTMKKSYRRTTNSSGVVRFANLIADLKLDHVNQVWVSDITYYRIGNVFYYITFIMDLYSRLIVGYKVSQSLRTESTTIPALKMGLRTREALKLVGLIIHSDGGGQYYSNTFRKLTFDAGMLNSMGISVYENPNAERLNGVIKNNYIRHYSPKTFNQLVAMTSKAVKMYNTEKPHGALNKQSPKEFEMKIKKRVFKEKIMTTIY